VISAQALSCFLLLSDFAPDRHLAAAHSFAQEGVTFRARIVPALSGNRIGASVIGYVVAGSGGGKRREHFTGRLRATSSHDLYLVGRRAGGIALDGGVPGIGPVNARKREII